MIDYQFEWDIEKAAANFDKHGVSFQESVAAFLDAFAVERIDDRKDYGEERINMLAMCRGAVVHVTYSERGHRIRIISARQAEKHEQEDYYRENRF